MRRKRVVIGLPGGDLVPGGHTGDAFHIGGDQDFHDWSPVIAMALLYGGSLSEKLDFVHGIIISSTNFPPEDK